MYLYNGVRSVTSTRGFCTLVVFITEAGHHRSSHSKCEVNEKCIHTHRCIYYARDKMGNKTLHAICVFVCIWEDGLIVFLPLTLVDLYYHQ